jgi:hypothetical protein
MPGSIPRLPMGLVQYCSISVLYFGKAQSGGHNLKGLECAPGQPIRVMSASRWHFLEFLILRQKFTLLHRVSKCGIKAASHNYASVLELTWVLWLA